MASSSPSTGATITVFNYGSNGVAQLRARVGNPKLETRPAALPGYVRVFCLEAADWRGGVASICPVDPTEAEDVLVHGSIAVLTPAQKRRLDTFEGGYREVEVHLHGDGSGSQRAIAYVAGTSGRHQSRYTPALRVAPSEAYLTAIHAHLRSHAWPCASLDVRSSDAPRRVLSTWQHPGVAGLETLEAVCVEANVRRKAPWTMPAACGRFRRDLEAIGVKTVADLASALLLAGDDGGVALVDRLQTTTTTSSEDSSEDSSEESSSRSRFWDADASRALRELPIQRVFVYGTLQSGLVNHRRLGGLDGGEHSSSPELVASAARTLGDDFGLVLAGGGAAAYDFAYPSALRPDDARPGGARGPLRGELYAVSTAVLETSLDPLEGHPDFYERHRVEVVVEDAPDGRDRIVEAWCYFLADRDHIARVRAHPDTFHDIVPTGDWKTFILGLDGKRSPADGGADTPLPN